MSGDGPSAEGPTAPPRTARRPGSRLLAAAAVLLGAGLVVVTASRPWVTAAVSGLPGPGRVSADGRLVAPGTTAVALVAAAGAVVLLTGGRRTRAIVATLLVVAGLGLVGLSVPVVRAPAAAVAPAVATATGTTQRPAPGAVSATVWPGVCILGGLLVAAGGGVALARGRGWAGPSARYERERPGSPGGSGPGAGGRVDTWDRLSAGEDPTDDSGPKPS